MVSLKPLLEESMMDDSEETPLIRVEPEDDEETSSHHICFCQKLKYINETRGRTKICCRTGSRAHCVIGPHWPYLFLTYLVIGALSGLVYAFLIIQDAKLEFIIFGLSLTALVIISLSLLAFVDPGIVQGHMLRKGGKRNDEMWSYCDRCSTFRPPRTIHCNECQVCIEQYDHHCPWTGKCVGKNNIWFFNIFVTSCICCVIYDVAVVLTVYLEGE